MYKIASDILSDNPIGTIIDTRPDGSIIYMSSRGVLNLDDHTELRDEQSIDQQYLESLPI